MLWGCPGNRTALLFFMFCSSEKIFGMKFVAIGVFFENSGSYDWCY